MKSKYYDGSVINSALWLFLQFSQVAITISEEMKEIYIYIYIYNRATKEYSVSQCQPLSAVFVYPICLKVVQAEMRGAHIFIYLPILCTV